LSEPQAGTLFLGNDLLKQIAEFWYTRPTRDLSGNGLWNINSNKNMFYELPNRDLCRPFRVLDVMPPDENQVDVDNSVYTNAVANLAVSTARWTTCLSEGPEAAEAAIPNEWLERVKNLVFVFNEKKRYHEEYEGFDDQYSTG